MTPEDLEKLLKLIALINASAQEVTKLLANKATQGGLTTEQLFARAEEHNDAALEVIKNL